MIGHAPPSVARLLLRLLPLGERRTDIEGDLLELFHSRAAARGVRYARRRYVGDVLSGDVATEGILPCRNTRNRNRSGSSNPAGAPHGDQRAALVFPPSG